jgi:hypothetical protein
VGLMCLRRSFCSVPSRGDNPLSYHKSILIHGIERR